MTTFCLFQSCVFEKFPGGSAVPVPVKEEAIAPAAKAAKVEADEEASSEDDTFMKGFSGSSFNTPCVCDRCPDCPDFFPPGLRRAKGHLWRWRWPSQLHSGVERACVFVSIDAAQSQPATSSSRSSFGRAVVASRRYFADFETSILRKHIWGKVGGFCNQVIHGHRFWGSRDVEVQGPIAGRWIPVPLGETRVEAGWARVNVTRETMLTEVSVAMVSTLPSMESTLPSNPFVAAACQGDIHAMQSMVTKHGRGILSTRDTIEGCAFSRGWNKRSSCPIPWNHETVHSGDRLPLPGTPALGAARNGRTEVLQFLVTHTMQYQTEPSGVTELLTSTTAFGSTPAHLAARGGWVDALSFLIDHLGDAALSARDNDGWLPAHSAARGGHSDVLRLIALHTSPKAVLDEQGSGPTVKSVARKYGQKEVGKLIQEFSLAVTPTLSKHDGPRSPMPGKVASSRARPKSAKSARRGSKQGSLSTSKGSSTLAKRLPSMNSKVPKHLTLDQLSNIPTLDIPNGSESDTALITVGGYVHLKHRSQLTRRDGLTAGDATDESIEAIQVVLEESFSSRGSTSDVRRTPSSRSVLGEASSSKGSSAALHGTANSALANASVLAHPALADLDVRYQYETSCTPAAEADVQREETDEAAEDTADGAEGTTEWLRVTVTGRRSPRHLLASGEQPLMVRHSMLETIRVLGSGVVGQVHLVRHSESRARYALKSMRKKAYVDSNASERVLDEVSLLRSCCGHPSIITLHAAFQDTTHLHLLTEVALGGELCDLVSVQEPLSTPHARFYAASLNAALIHCHDRQVIFRDLKAENVLIDSAGYVKLCDFGFAKRCANAPYALPSPRP